MLERCFEELLDRSEAMTREALRKLPDGTYRYVDFLDNDGVDLDRQVRIEVAVTIKDGTIALRPHRHRPRSCAGRSIACRPARRPRRTTPCAR